MRYGLRVGGLSCAAIAVLAGALHAAAQGPDLGSLEGRIVFSSNRSGTWRIWIIGADGNGFRQVTEDDADAQDVDPMFSPDGKAILFSSNRGGDVGVWTIPSAGGGAMKRLCDGDQAEWRPDGRAIAFRRDNRLWVRDLETGEERAITPEDWPFCSGPAWRPDGRAIAFAARWDAGNGIYIVSLDGGTPRKIYDKQGACEPHFTPDGQLIVYETETHICTIQPDGEKNRMVTYLAGVQRYGRVSPDGKHIVYCQGVSERGPWELYVVPLAGGIPTRLTEGESDMNPHWR